MDKTELIAWLQDAYRQWKALLDEIGPDRMEIPGACGDWTAKDVAAHLTGWQQHLNARMQAALRGEPQPPPPWPAHLHEEDEINAWLYRSNRDRPLQDVLDDMDHIFDETIAVIKGLPDDVPIERKWRLVSLGGERFPAGEFFDHFRDDHEAEMRAWLEQTPTA